MRRATLHALLALLCFVAPAARGVEGGVRLKELARLGSAHDNSLVGYGLVTGLAGTGDTSRSFGTVQSISNVLRRFGVNVAPLQLRTRNVAGVMVTGTLPAFARKGDKLDVNVTSLGDARSLLGGTLVLAPLADADGVTRALAQGPLLVGGFKYDLNGNVVQKNHPTSATIPVGATVERDLDTPLRDGEGAFEYVLFDPDLTTASRIATAINARLAPASASVVDAGRVRVAAPGLGQDTLVALMTEAENLLVEPDLRARVVVNERTGTVVSGGDVRLEAVSISHGNLRVSISTQYFASQPEFVSETGAGVRTVVLPDTTIEVEEEAPASVTLERGSTVAELVSALNRVQATSRDIVSILQAIKRAGALHAELVVQ